MRILFIDNNLSRHEGHKKIIDRFNNHEFCLREDCTKDDLKESNYDIYIVHRGNQRAYKCIFIEKLGDHRIFFSGGESNPKETDHGIYADTKTLKEELKKLLENAQ